jgi:hypothetical protein
MSRFALALLLAATASSSALAQMVPAETVPSPADRRPFYSRIRGLFDFDLPDIDPPGTVKLILHPHFGDLIRRDYMRIDGGFRWALNNRLEISPEASVYFTHGINGGGPGYGVGEVRLGTKYVIPAWPRPTMETSLTLGVERPVGHAPIDMTDGLNHVTPGFLIQHRSREHWKLTTFGGAGLDLVSNSKVLGTPVRNQPLDDSMNFTIGAVYDMGQIRYTLATTYATTAGLGDETHNYFYVRPNILWYIPKKYTFNSKTQWIIAVGARASWGPDGSEVSFSNRVRAEITFRQVMEKIRPKKPDDDKK